ncbi:MAG: M15 family metallopeptidase [Acidobacteria bacterium]|nr:M15 family metallopeptidase [Acidobacteriota bacterium]
MTLLEHQQLFARLLPRLLTQALLMGFDVTLGETYRPDATVELYALQGKGSRRSVHPLRLAIDLHLFRKGVFLTRTEDHAALGAWWEAQHPFCRWGGRFPRPDGNHFSLTWEGRA